MSSKSNGTLMSRSSTCVRPSRLHDWVWSAISRTRLQQVSYPVTEWTQLLPRRTVEVRRSKTEVAIHVEGLATSPPPSSVKIGADDERPAVPRMIACIVRKLDLEVGVPTQRIVWEAAFGEANITNLPGSDDAYRTVNARFTWRGCSKKKGTFVASISGCAGTTCAR